MTAHSLARCHGCPHLSAPNQNPDATCSTSPNLQGFEGKPTNKGLNQRMRHMHESIDAELHKLDSALRRTWLWLGGVLLPSAGAIVYTMAALT